MSTVVDITQKHFTLHTVSTTGHKRVGLTATVMGRLGDGGGQSTVFK